MNYYNKPQYTLQAVLVITCLVALSGTPQQANAGQFEPPSMEGFTLHNERDADGDGDGVNETRIRHYLNKEGDSLVSMSTRDVIWAWSLDTHDNDSGVKNYVIRDSNCDGIFDEVYSLDDEFHVPGCLQQPDKTGI